LNALISKVLEGSQFLKFGGYQSFGHCKNDGVAWQKPSLQRYVQKIDGSISRRML
jgi:hypothetical protein